MAAGRVLGRMSGSTGYHNVDGLRKWLDPYIENRMSITYTTCRQMSAMSPTVLQSETYEQLMKDGKNLSETWNFGVVALASAVSQIAQAFRQHFKGTALRFSLKVSQNPKALRVLGGSRASKEL